MSRPRRKPNNKPQTRGNKDYTNEKEMQDKAGKNDLVWHSKSDALLTEAASIPWSWSTGRPIVLNGTYDTAPDVSFKYVLPGLMAVRTAITPGTGITKSDALNIAAQALYTDIRRMLKSANAYEASDVMIYITAVGEVMAYISWLTRLYATTMLYSYRNAYLPDQLISMQGVDADDLHNHALEFLSRANQLIAKASQIYIPKGLDFLERCRWEYANYYTEGDSIKDQIYFFTPGLFRKFEMIASEDYKGGLNPCIKLTHLTTYKHDYLLNVLEDMINALIGDSDFANIAGDLMNRYGEGGVMNFALIPQDAVMSIVSGAAAFEILEQIQNARCLGGVHNAWGGWNFNPEGGGDPAPEMFWVKQGAGAVENQMLTIKAFTTQEVPAAQRGLFIADAVDSLITVHSDPSAAKTMLVTRFNNMMYGVEDAVTEASYWIEAAADYVLSFDLRCLASDGTVQSWQLKSAFDESVAAVDGILLKLRPFHYAPTFYLSTGANMTDFYGGLDIVAPITVTQLRDINRVDLMSLFAVPDVGKVTGK